MGSSAEALSDQVSAGVRLPGEHVACLSLFTEPSEPLPEGPKLEGMAFHHCHKNRVSQSGLSPERAQARRQLYAACIVCLIFMAGEVVGKLGTTLQSHILNFLGHSPSRTPGFLGGEARKRKAGRDWKGGTWRGGEFQVNERACGLWPRPCVN